MERTIWKFQLDKADVQLIKIPSESEILTVQSQGNNPCLWALVNPESPKKEITIETFGTGHNIPDDSLIRKYIGTYQLYNGTLIFHVFARD